MQYSTQAHHCCNIPFVLYPIFIFIYHQRSKTLVQKCPLGTSVTHNLTAHSKRTIAAYSGIKFTCVVASTAAHVLTRFTSRCVGVALASICPQGARDSVLRAEVRRGLRVHEVHLVRWTHVHRGRQKGVAMIGGDHSDCGTEATLQHVANISERAKCSPTGAHDARAGEAVAFTFRLHAVPSYLWGKSVSLCLLLVLTVYYLFPHCKTYSNFSQLVLRLFVTFRIISV